MRARRQRTGLGSATAAALGGLSIVALMLSACTDSRAGADLSLAELAALTVAGRDDLTSAERNLLDLAGYRLAIGVMVGAYCPEQLPLDADVILADVELGDPDAYREILPSLFPADHGAAAFVEQLSDRRLEQLQRAACRATARAETLGELGAAILDQYDDVLRDVERQAVDVDEYIDLVGSLLGWFCPAELVPDLSP